MSEDLAREQAVRTLVVRIAHTIDTRRWDDLRALYDDEVTTDYTSLFGGEVQRQAGDALITGWRSLLGTLDATQHLAGPIDVRLEGDRATAECHVRGYHVRRGAPGGDEWMVAGQWVIRAVERGGQWRVTAMALRAFYETGNRRVLEVGA
jgi:SnoaL-like domain